MVRSGRDFRHFVLPSGRGLQQEFPRLRTESRGLLGRDVRSTSSVVPTVWASGPCACGSVTVLSAAEAGCVFAEDDNTSSGGESVKLAHRLHTCTVPDQFGCI
ncbi:UNVERIFIED_CONTAM: hypothetical protein Slati_0832500 [Sesamum latifolium]|uniref:Uncharacterized protein n=1 Tax=Sesamum latifolium TaxID=2727402 RepID=A0AAW2XLF0_9LAMI